MAKNGYSMTTQTQVRAAFWEAHPHAVRKPGRQNEQPTDTRVAFVDYVDSLEKDSQISEALAQRVTL